MIEEDDLTSTEMTYSRENILEGSIGRLSVALDFGFVNFISEKNRTEFLALYKKGVFSEEEVKARIHERLIEIGKRTYQEILRGTRPDHTLSPESLGYIIKHGILSAEEISLIDFDHNETADEYVMRAEDALNKVFGIVVSPIPEKYSNVEGVSFEPCDCVSCDYGPCGCC